MLMKSSQIKVDHEQQFEEILTPEALEFLEKLHWEFDERRQYLLSIRELVQNNFNTGKKPNFLSETKDIREQEWTISPLPDDLQDQG